MKYVVRFNEVGHKYPKFECRHVEADSKEEAIKNGTDIKSITQIVEMTGQREMVNDTDKGAELRTQIKDLQDLLLAYQKGILKEK